MIDMARSPMSRCGVRALVLVSSLAMAFTGCELVVPLDDYLGDPPDAASERDPRWDSADGSRSDRAEPTLPRVDADADASPAVATDAPSRSEASTSDGEPSDVRSDRGSVRDVASEATSSSDARESASRESSSRDGDARESSSRDGEARDAADGSDTALLRDASTTCAVTDCGAPISPVGCSDGTREAFIDTTRFRMIAGCGGQWSASSMRAPRTGVACGNSLGRRCTAPVDACAEGWHVCGDAPYGGTDVSSKVTLAECRAQTGEFAAAISDKVCELCSPEGSGAACCGDGCVAQLGSCIYPGATDWFGVIAGHVNLCSDIAAENADQGVMCCRNP